MSQNDPAVQAMTEATLAVFDILAARGARSGKGFMRTAFTPQGRRKAIADALARFVPEGTTRGNVEAVSLLRNTLFQFHDRRESLQGSVKVHQMIAGLRMPRLQMAQQDLIL